MKDRSTFWKTCGILAALVICAMSAARMTLVAIPIIPVLVLPLSNLTKTWPYATGAGGLTLALPLNDVDLQDNR